MVVGVRSRLMELKYYPLSKFYIDPVNRVLMSSQLFLLVPCKTRCFQVDLLRIFVFLIHRIHRQKILSVVCSNSDLLVSMLN